jgi:type I restriction enzyme M protein
LEKHKQLAGRIENVEPALQTVSGQQFYNTSPLTFTKLLDDPGAIADSLKLYIGGFSEAAKDVIDKFDFGVQIDRLRRANVLYQVLGKFAEIDLHPDVVSNIEMGYLYGSAIDHLQWQAVRRSLVPLVMPGRICRRLHQPPSWRLCGCGSTQRRFCSS